jgi:hypothetical protein
VYFRVLLELANEEELGGVTRQRSITHVKVYEGQRAKETEDLRV